jgi:hypothetical protein
MSEYLLYIGGFLTILWGTAHLFPTKSVVEGFGDISQDNKQIITMEWLVEGIALIFVGTLVLIITFIDPRTIISTTTYVMTSIFLIVMAIVSLFTGFKVNFLPYKLCPVIFTASAVLISIGWVTIN